MARNRRSASLLRRIRWLTLSLLASGIANALLLGGCLYLYMQRSEISFDYEQVIIPEPSPQEVPRSVSSLLRTYESLSFTQLVEKLSSKRPLEDGYRERDLGLAVLVALHDFDLERALGGQTVERRIVRFNDQSAGRLPAIVLFPGLSQSQYRQVEQVAREEEWPLTSRGLFRRLQNQDDESLVQTFALTPEFHSVELLLARANVNYEKEEIVELVTSGKWKKLSDFTEQQRSFSPESRREFLLSYVRDGSCAASALVIRTDRPYVVDVLDDRDLIAVISHLERRSAEVRGFLIDLLTSPRSTAVWIASAERLYTFADEPMPQPYNHIETLSRFVPEDLLRAKVEMGNSRPRRRARPITLHEVEDGDSLWKIARRYETTIARLREHNELETDLIRRGQTLMIPID